MRIDSLDSFRIIAAFLVVSLHVTWPIASVGSFFSDMCRIAVPYFLMLSGFFYKREHTFNSIKKTGKYMILSAIAYFIIELFLYRSPYFVSEEISLLFSYKFWICNAVPFCPVAWYLFSYIYILLIVWLIRYNKYVYVLGGISFLFALITGPYSRVLGIYSINSLLWNCSFLSTFCWFSLGLFIRSKYKEAKTGRIFFGTFICGISVILGLAISISEHIVLKHITHAPVNGTVFLGTLIAVAGLFLFLLHKSTWSFFSGCTKIRDLALFVFLSHIGINYILISISCPQKLNLPYPPIYSSISGYINNFTVYIICILLYCFISIIYVPFKHQNFK